VTGPSAAEAPPRPADVDTGFWLWLVALPLLLIGQVVDIFTTGTAAGSSTYVAVATTAIVLAVGAVVATFLWLMRSGYRWTRTLLTGGGLATIFYTLASVFGTVREPTAAVVFAVTGIVGSVLIAGGVFLLHRPDSTRFFTR
jgi:peptidoglycan/LPS O-acetylase OafA/YrhL